MAEFETYHRQKVEDFERFAVEHLDGEIEFYEQVCLAYPITVPSLFVHE